MKEMEAFAMLVPFVSPSVRRYRHRGRPLPWRLATVLLALAAAAPAMAETLPTDSPHRPLIFQYVTPFREGNTAFSSVMALSPEHMTTAEGENPLIDGIILILPWSIFEPAEGRVDFTDLDAALAYWAKKGKPVVLNIAPMTFPTMVGKAWGGKLITGTPDWVLQQSGAVTVPGVRMLYPTWDEKASWAMPTPWNPRFEQAYDNFIRQLAQKYDGDPRLIAVRIGTGMEGEEHPMFNNTLKDMLPGFTNAKWYSYCMDVLATHVAAFRHTPLEMDLDWAGVAYHENKDGSREMVEKLIAQMKQDHVVFGNNGWRGTPPPNKSGYTAIDQLIRQYHDDGYPVALEVGGIAQDKHMQDTASLLAQAQRLAPVRINFMGNTAAVLNFAEGINDPRDEVSLERYKAAIGTQGDPLVIAKNFRQLVIDVRKINVPTPPWPVER
jgi:hypothetical protein